MCFRPPEIGMRKKCPACGAENDDSDMVCTACGEMFPEAAIYGAPGAPPAAPPRAAGAPPAPPRAPAGPPPAPPRSPRA